jgi:hypothetical protein
MRAISPHDASIRGSTKAPATLTRAIEKTSASNALNDEKQDLHGERRQAAAPLRVEHVCRDDTLRRDPFWDAPRLVPTFVAQLLGQVMPQRRESIPVETAYGRTVSPRKALLLDRKS